ncbi:calponin homology domain-containing protein [Pavlovales sp. CCMP2436]|nr:calponin homology domain-containing protein [Pavlovales sp. CCMP2436]|mmetsp:Transcript_43300/g.106940  ORF Transcript_43300/g.106940 Transcript_43300/m.106940 type:complete len:264 (+) Transcript_43300:53-844(+)|eukprot:CAMPEP_0179878796 /NCGR_PEP_ID=MMETSP0982-20121206/25654_1 /TAXON_ID=483367 /ORGANISM="non described non described, Strain CCMP 2436" /LENGTH=263 /DNA_ID=CAMNT_0021771765 /DNA_START=110 /DNA_END=901 /DNA_ORIENTATION=-
MATAGMMNEAYFTGRKEIVAWIQGKFSPSLQRVEDLCTGTVYCQIIDSIYPNTVPLNKVKFQAKTETEFIHNFKVLQAAFAKNKLDRHIDVEKLCKRNFQMNLEFIQWMKILHDTMVDPQDHTYNAEERLRQAGQKPLATAQLTAPAKRAAPSVSAPSAVAKKENVQPASKASVPKAAEKVAQQLEITELKITVDGLEKERDFYFGKLRDIEILCQTNEEQSLPFLQSVLAILYQTEEDFVTPTDAEGGEGAAEPIEPQAVEA